MKSLPQALKRGELRGINGTTEGRALPELGP
jgi:hypothetical protein